MTLEKLKIEELKSKLTSNKEQLVKELAIIANKKTGVYETKFNEIGSDEDENASEIEEYSDNLALESNLESQLKAINEALTRIDNGSYGYCSNCKEEIGFERLEAFPAAKTCIKCKE